MTDRPTWIIAGLGNPGKKYERTRHNVGFMVVDTLEKKLAGNNNARRFDAEIFERTTETGRVVLLKPQTFMNASGNAVGAAARWYRVPFDHLLVVYDDLDLPFGQLRLRPSGSSGGHNGMKSIIDRVGSDQFPRLRLGIGRDQHSGAIGYVLSRFTSTEAAKLRAMIERASAAAISWQRDGIDDAMNEFNRREEQPESKVSRKTVDGRSVE